MVGGSMVVFGAVVLLMPLVVTTLSRPVRWVLGRLFGATGRVAMDNARRHPIRFAATTSALIVGIAPLTTFAVLLTTARVQGERELAENLPVDFVVSHADIGGHSRPGFPEALVAHMGATPDFGVVALSRTTETNAEECCHRVGTTEPGVLGSRLALEVREGGLGGLPPGTAAVNTSFAAAHGTHVGDRITVGPPDHSWTPTVVATFDNAPIAVAVIVNWSDFAKHLTGNDDLLIRRADGSTAASAAAALDAALADDPLVVISSAASRRESLAHSLDRRLTQANVLLGLSLVIALLGIANTLSLAVLERTRESALLRALGLARRQMVGMLLLEAALMALVGAAVGVAFGIGFGWITARELIRTYGHGAPDIPVGTIATYVGLAALAGAVASILPARRAASASIVSAMTDELRAEA
jgi:putative ABC transport system permease protein